MEKMKPQTMIEWMEGKTERQGWKQFNKERGMSLTFKDFRKLLKIEGVR